MTRDLADVLTPGLVSDRDFIYTDCLTTVVALVPDSAINDFINRYETFSEYVVPNSAKYVEVPNVRKFNYEDKKENIHIFRVVLVKEAILNEDVDISPEQQAKIKTPLQEFADACRDKVKLLNFHNC